ncbi:MAG: MCP four helix bundle domain-containing protein [Spirochaetes bacterium]|nr:MCP four helix bundle domain-containing protein [Spirochaetota bacterium]
MFKNLKIGPKLIAGFVLVAIIAGFIGVFAIYNMKQLDEADTFMYEKTTLPISYCVYLTESFQRARVNLVKMFTTNDKKEIDGYYKRNQDFEKILVDYEKKYEFTIIDENDKKLFNEYLTSKKKYFEETNSIYKLLLNDNINEALVILNGSAFEAANTHNANIQKIIELNIDSAHKTAEDNTKLANTISIIMILITIFGFILALILGIFLSQSISKPIGVATDLAIEIGKGDLLVTVPEIYLNRGDEIGKLAIAYKDMISSLKIKSDVIEKISQGDLTVNPVAVSDKDNLGKSLIVMVDSLNEILGQVNIAIDQVSSGSVQVSQASQSLSQGASEQASSLEEITSSVTEVNSQSRQNTENATQVNQISKQAMNSANAGNNKMKEVVSAMVDINKSAEGIKKVAKAIDDIAFQINLLALNANVEAARAGKYGKGFAVVAEEVRNLAVRSGQSAKETTQLVEDAIKNISNGNSLANETSKQIDDIVGISSKVADIAEEVTTASKEQTTALEQINTALSQIDQVTQANTANAEESASAAEELASQSEQLKAMIGRFNLRNQNNSAQTLYSKDNTTKKSNKTAQTRAITHIEHKVNIKNPKDVIALDDNNFDTF